MRCQECWAQARVVSRRFFWSGHSVREGLSWSGALAIAWHAYEWERAGALGACVGSALAKEVEFFVSALRRL